MSNLLNLSLVEGNLVRAPELFYTKNGYSVCKFDIAVDNGYKTGDQEVKQVCYISVNCWNKIAENCAKYLKKGSLVRVNGKIKQNFWNDKDGKKHNKIYLEALNVDFLRTPSKKKNDFDKVPF